MKKILITLLLSLSASDSWSMTMLNLFGTLVLSGEIKRGEAADLSKKLDGGITKVTLRSPGGNLNEAIQMAQVLRTSGKMLVVEGPCISSCAFLFAFVDLRSVRDGGFLAFHAGDLYLLDSLLPAFANYVPQDPVLAEKFERARKTKLDTLEAQRKLIREINVQSRLDERWLERLTLLTAPIIRSIRIDEKLETVTADTTPPKCDWWVPDIQGLADIGIILNKYQPIDRSSIAKKLGDPINRIYWEKLPDIDSLNSQACEETKHEH